MVGLLTRWGVKREAADVPAPPWLVIATDAARAFGQDQIPMIAAGVTFFSVLALFPALAVFASLYGLVDDVGDVQQQIQALTHVLPGAALTIVGDQLTRLAKAPHTGLSVGLVVGLLVALWSANGAVKAIMIGLNVAYETKESRGFIRKTLISFVFTLGVLAFSILAAGALGVVPALGDLIGPGAASLLTLATWAALVLARGIGLAMLYRYGPDRHLGRIQWISWGAAGVVLTWLAVSALFSLYVVNFAHYNKTYGALGAAIGFMTWLYLSNLVVLGGAELNAAVERARLRSHAATAAPR